MGPAESRLLAGAPGPERAAAEDWKAVTTTFSGLHAGHHEADKDKHAAPGRGRGATPWCRATQRPPYQNLVSQRP
jgi:hypothetical protein